MLSEKFRHSSSRDLLLLIQSFIDGFRNDETSRIKRKALMTQEFYKVFEQRLRRSREWLESPEDDIVRAMNEMEIYVFNKLYDMAFCPLYSGDMVEDDEIYEKILSFQTVESLNPVIPKPEWLDFSIVSEKQYKVIREINHVKSPCEKMNKITQLIVSLSATEVKGKDKSLEDHRKQGLLGEMDNYQDSQITNIETSSNSELMPADTLVPLIIYAIIKENPRNLISNLKYCQRFRNKIHTTGMQDFCFTNFAASISFVMSDRLNTVPLDPKREEIQKSISEHNHRILKILGSESFDMLAISDLRFVHDEFRKLFKNHIHTSQK